MKTTNVKTVQGFDFFKFIDAVAMRNDFKRMAFSFMADLSSFFYFEELGDALTAKEQGYYSQFAMANLDEMLSWTPSQVANMEHRYLAKAVRGITTMNSKYREETHETFMRKIKKEDGLWDLQDTRDFFQEFEETFDRHYNPKNIPGQGFRDIAWPSKKI